VHEAGAGEVGDVVGEREMRIKSNTKIADRDIRGESSGRSVIGEVVVGDLGGLGGRSPQNLRWRTAHASVPPIF